MNFKIHNLTWNIITVPHGDERLGWGKNEAVGICDCWKTEIYIDNTLQKPLFRTTVIHELVHAFIFSYGSHLTCNARNEEPVCDFVACYLDEIYKLTNRIMDKIYNGS